MATGKYEKAFIELRASLYIPETSGDYEDLLEELWDTVAYQAGLRDGLTAKRQREARQRLRKPKK